MSGLRHLLQRVGCFLPTAHQGDVRTIEFTPDNHWMVSIDGNNAARMWDLRSPDPTAKFFVFGHEAGVGLVAISPDSRWLATAGAPQITGPEDRVVRLWDLAKPDPSASPFILLGHERAISTMAISDDSRWLLTGSEDGSMRLWDLKTATPGTAPIVMTGHGAGVRSVVVSPDSRYVASADGVGVVRLWHLRQDDLIALARAVAGRNFSQDEWGLFFQGQPYRKTFAELPGPQPLNSRDQAS
jgi:WD40 repeat protein